MKNKKNIIVIILVIIGILLFAFGIYKIITSNNSIKKDNNIANSNVDSNNEINNTTEQNNNKSSKFELKQLGNLEYYLYTPNNPTSNMPLIMYLHGATFKKEDISKNTEKTKIRLKHQNLIIF